MERHTMTARNTVAAASKIAIGGGLTGLMILVAVPSGASAQTTFNGFGGVQYDQGLNPSVAVTALSGPFSVEVHNGGNGAGPLWYRVGRISGSTISWSDSQQYDNFGLNPSVAAPGVEFSGGLASVVEVHNGGPSAGPLWYRTGTVSASTIDWSDSHQFDDFGFNPSVGAAGGTIVEVHNGGNGAGPLWYRTGTLSADGTLTWNESHEYDQGFNPSVSVRFCLGIVDSAAGQVTPECGIDVLEVHNGTDSPGQMWWRYGRVSSDGKTINWQPPQPYDTGWNPKIAWFTTPIGIGPNTATIAAGAIEVHNGQAGVGPLWYHTAPTNPLGAANNIPPVAFSPAVQFDVGNNPSIAIDTNGGCPSAVEVQNSATTSGPELYHAGTYTCP
jgi:hypothetical protein